MVVFTMVTEAINEIALPFRTVCSTFPAVEKVTPASLRIVPTMVPPPAPLIVAALPIYQNTFFGEAPLVMMILRGPVGVPTVIEDPDDVY